MLGVTKGNQRQDSR